MGRWGEGAYIWDANWVTFLAAFIWGHINVILRYIYADLQGSTDLFEAPSLKYILL